MRIINTCAIDLFSAEAPTSDAYVQEYVEDIQVGDFGEGYIVELLYRAPERGRTAIDFYAENGDRILHVNPRYDENVSQAGCTCII